ncbi:MAG: helix-turn-helix transcriptional regulator [Rhodobacteraceae bacterium]|nr:helix-turn-helix transcriptional regulator [Paracoccaceae bacterium]
MLLARWSNRIVLETVLPILPDGCRDLICVERPGRAPVWVLTDLQQAPMPVRLAGGQQMTGFRLRPGSRLDARQALDALSGQGPGAAGAVIDAFAQPGPAAEALAGLSGAPSVAQAARALGVSPRALQRMMARETGVGPDFWRRLGQARRAARAVLAGDPLAEAAADAGYADQAHMTRAFRGWFGVTPGQLCIAHPLATQLTDSGYGDTAS